MSHEKRAEREIEVDSTPRTSTLAALCNDDMSWLEAIAEWLDNSFDAGATSVAIEFGKDDGAPYVSIKDNGTGCENLALFVTMGAHQNHPTTDLGVYGVGGGNALLWACGESAKLHVCSTHKRRTRGMHWDYAKVQTHGWKQKPPYTDEDALPGECGTQILMSPVVRKVPEGKRWEELVEGIGYLYSSAIKSGRHITIRSKLRAAKPERIERWKLPKLDPGHVDTKITVAGKTARVYFGIVSRSVPDNHNKRPGFTYSHGFRVIKGPTAKGTGKYGPAGVCGFVELDEGWTLTKHKNGISTYEEELYDEVLRVSEPVLKRAEQAGRTLESAALLSDVEGFVNSMAFAEKDEKAKRGPKTGEHGPVRPTGKGRKHRGAANRQPGDTFSSRGAQMIKIGFDDFGDDRTGKVEFAGPIVHCTLSRSHPAIVRYQRAKNTDALALLVFAMCLQADMRTEANGQTRMLLRGAGGDFDEHLGAILKASAKIDGEDIGAERGAAE